MDQHLLQTGKIDLKRVQTFQERAIKLKYRDFHSLHNFICILKSHCSVCTKHCNTVI